MYVSSEVAEAGKAIVKKMRSNELYALNSTIEKSDTNSNPEIINKTLSIEEIDNYETTSNGIIANVEEPIGLQKQYVVFEPEQIHI